MMLLAKDLLLEDILLAKLFLSVSSFPLWPSVTILLEKRMCREMQTPSPGVVPKFCPDPCSSPLRADSRLLQVAGH